MNVTYWNKLAARYSDQVIEIIESDVNAVLARAIKTYIKKNHVVADLGCGPGSLLPLLSKRAKKVYAVDFAQELLNLAQQRYSLPNVIYQQHNLASRQAPAIKADVVCCINALIHPSTPIRLAMLRNIRQCLKPSGTGIIVVPSFESIVYVYQIVLELQLQEGVSESRARQSLEKVYAKEVVSSVSGIVKVGGEPTKCYTQEELVRWLSKEGFKIDVIQKIEFPWKEELDDAPANLKGPYPWDWLIIFKKK